MAMNLIEKTGDIILKTLQSARDVGLLFIETLYWTILGPFKKKVAKREGIFSQMVYAGFDSIIIVFFVAFFTGIVIAMQSAY